MGCCISKCKPQKLNSIQDINNLPKINPKFPISIPTSNQITPISSPSTSSTSYSACTDISTDTISSSSSSSSTLKVRTFSNEFLWKSVKENPHIIRINSIKECSANLYSRKWESPMKNSIPERIIVKTTPQKRIRSNSPTPLNRQKSFRRDVERINSNSLHSFPLKSASPSMRFNGRSATSIKESCSKRNHNNNYKVNDYSISLRKGNRNSSLTETRIHRVSSKIDDLAVQQALTQHDSDAVPMEEDIDNPLISLDCFIFL